MQLRVLGMDSESSELKLVYQVQAYPAMVLSYSYPRARDAQEQQLMGLDLLGAPGTRAQVLAQLQANSSTIILGPFATPQGFKALSVVRHMVLPVPYLEYDWGCGRQLSNCSGEEGPCLFRQRGAKLWGRVSSTISLDNLQAAFGLDALADTYRFKLSQLATAFNPPEVIAASDQPPLLPVAISISSLNLRWVLQVEPFAGWEPAWRAPCVAAVLLASAAVSLLVLWLLVSRERHDMLLCSMLPKRVIKQLHSGRNVVENFPAPVTVLFSDIVSYCEVASQLTPLQVVELLNDLYTVFDSLTVTHGCYKVETIGDCFVATAGCPYHEDPVSAAVRVAGMAQGRYCGGRYMVRPCILPWCGM
ncbi:Soluble guanylate cyclase gcy-31 [Tetrabaena socialis]|uniref:Soluble guanylate cyclase gcy-31 n=1 Tax=Tetrabaena socialis TaxID=47790 RepID=A0A2J7ZPU5_9CHLO|nr:Soluble guanylate cyclase gcy-31 [Tetrabaena socialis]|eukprot:PNH02291.1 Soluble guanylate cyclase gcy-31 [Tetrabaena socialis]